MSHSETRSAIVLELAEEFLARYRKGERPPLGEYIDRHPELAVEIREVFPAMAMMENIAVADESMMDPDGKSHSSPGTLSLCRQRWVNSTGTGARAPFLRSWK